MCATIVPPSFSAIHAEGHDLLEGIIGDASQQRVAGQLATLPMRMGRLGSRSPARIAHSILGSWSDALHMIHRRLSQTANSFIQQVENGGALQNACDTLPIGAVLLDD